MAKEKKCYSFNGKILKVNLTTGAIDIEEPGEAFYRKYLGGSAVGVYYCLTEMKAGTDPLGPDNVLVFAAGILTGGAFSGASRFCVTAKSPLTGCIGDSQCGGGWGPELNFAGFDAVVITGKSDKPVYLWINDGVAKLRGADEIWGIFTADTRAEIAKSLDDEKIKVACIGPAGERMVRFANISGGGSDYAGRTGLGAVMGSKNLKAIACRGTKKPEYADADGVKRVTKASVENFKRAGFQQLLKQLGTAGATPGLNAVGSLPTRNFSRGSFEGVMSLSGDNMKKTIGHPTEACYACIVRCKQVVKAEEPYKVDPAYGGPEYETIGMLGSNLEIDDIVAVARANQLCNAYGMDTITTGAMIAYITESFENALISKRQTGGRELRFGDADMMLDLVEAIGKREGLGDKLANGMEACIDTFGAKTAEFAMHVKNNPLPAHVPQVKLTMALMYAVNTFGADHMSCEHDWFIQGLGKEAMGMSLDAKRKQEDLDYEKVRMVVYTQQYYSLIDTLSLCLFCWGPGALFSFQNLVDMINSATGWETNFFELMKAGERRVNMMRAFNAREGIDSQYDRLPKRVFEAMPGPGMGEGKRVPIEELEQAIKTYYSMMNWDAYTGNPSPAKLQELGLSWILDL